MALVKVDMLDRPVLGPWETCQEISTELPKAQISFPEGSNAYRSYCDYFNKDREPWVDAELYCQNMHSRNLVSVLTQAEGAFMASLSKEGSTSDCSVWTGFRDPKKNRCWHWSSRSLVSYKSWDTGAPGSASPGCCANLRSSSGYRKWKDESCKAEFSFVCKFRN
ncbi:lithostathine-1-beta-like [Nycticebus coucang]|uniref:lithostathine-1-beta-like n=1 Tax=Nycticebus coucang TaxID=9470 RepID=UPI00234DE11F|nr:lithostathine-1-beta-like [Nycticebus coucang]